MAIEDDMVADGRRGRVEQVSQGTAASGNRYVSVYRRMYGAGNSQRQCQQERADGRSGGGGGGDDDDSDDRVRGLVTVKPRPESQMLAERQETLNMLRSAIWQREGERKSGRSEVDDWRDGWEADVPNRSGGRHTPGPEWQLVGWRDGRC